MTEKLLGLIAGNGKFPILFARKARSQGYKVITAGIRGDTSFLMQFCSDKYQRFKVGELANLFKYFKKSNVCQVMMAGQVNPNNLFEQNVTFDDNFKALFEALGNYLQDLEFLLFLFHSLGEVFLEIQ